LSQFRSNCKWTRSPIFRLKCGHYDSLGEFAKVCFCSSCEIVLKCITCRPFSILQNRKDIYLISCSREMGMNLDYLGSFPFLKNMDRLCLHFERHWYELQSKDFVLNSLK
jgi:hypothetical protein